MIPGAHFVRPHTIDPNPRAYAQIDQHADHWHWDHSKELILGAPGVGDSQRGGGHAHSGLSIYLADQWPEPYRGRLLTLNFHGRRVNVERLERSGSGYVRPPRAGHPVRGRSLVPRHRPELWARRRRLHPRLERHRRLPRPRRRPPLVGPDLQGRRSATRRARRPVDLTMPCRKKISSPSTAHPNEWFVRQARRILCTRSAIGVPMDESKKALAALFRTAAEPAGKLRALWSLYVIGGLDRAFLRQPARSRTRVASRLGDPPADRRSADRQRLQPQDRGRRGTAG